MIRAALFANLAIFTVVASQPLFYLVSMTDASLALSAGAYIELRQRINRVMNRRVPVIYVGGLLTNLLVLALALQRGDRFVAATTAAALLCLVIDVTFMFRESLPINSVVDGWSTTAYPPDWQTYREKWFRIFRYRAIVLLIGFASLLVGVVFRSA